MARKRKKFIAMLVVNENAERPEFFLTDRKSHRVPGRLVPLPYKEFRNIWGFLEGLDKLDSASFGMASELAESFFEAGYLSAKQYLSDRKEKRERLGKEQPSFLILRPKGKRKGQLRAAATIGSPAGVTEPAEELVHIQPIRWQKVSDMTLAGILPQLEYMLRVNPSFSRWATMLGVMGFKAAQSRLVGALPLEFR